jgi:hypothetical protein
MTKTTYLFGEDIDKTIIEIQKSVAKYKIKKAGELLTKLLRVNMYARDDERIAKVIKAQQFWHNILEEEI